jgi:hypothetical protein
MDWKVHQMCVSDEKLLGVLYLELDGFVGSPSIINLKEEFAFTGVSWDETDGQACDFTPICT